MSQYVFNSKRTTIRHFCSSEEEMIYRVAYASPYDVSDETLQMIRHRESVGYYNVDAPLKDYVIIGSSSEQYIGCFSLEYFPEYDIATISYYLLTSEQGKGYGLEVLEVIVQELIIPITKNVFPYIVYAEDEEKPLVTQVSAEPLLTAITEVKTFSNYPSLSTSLKAGLKIAAIFDCLCYCVLPVGDYKSTIKEDAQLELKVLSKELYSKEQEGNAGITHSLNEDFLEEIIDPATKLFLLNFVAGDHRAKIEKYCTEAREFDPDDPFLRLLVKTHRASDFAQQIKVSQASIEEALDEIGIIGYTDEDYD